jgi:hypothetical protein
VTRAVCAPEQIDALFEGLESKTPRVKYGAAKALRVVSQQSPDVLYPRWDAFVRLLDSDNAFLRWGATQILGDLAAVDRENRFDALADRFFAPISGPEMIGAANAIAAAAGIVLAKPHLADRMVKPILKVERASYRTPECRNVAIGHAIKSFDKWLGHVGNKRPVLAFVTRQLDNPRPATRKKAEKFLKHWATAL